MIPGTPGFKNKNQKLKNLKTQADTSAAKYHGGVTDFRLTIGKLLNKQNISNNSQKKKFMRCTKKQEVRLDLVEEGTVNTDPLSGHRS